MEAAHESQTSTSRAWNVRAARILLLYAIPLAAGLVLRVWMLGKLFEVNGDTLVYGGLARNLMLHGRYALAGAGGNLYPTLIRLPGYPLFLALCFRLFGMENYYAAACAQIAMELGGCLLLAAAARRIAPPAHKAAASQATLWLAVLCPFTASYTAAPLAETPTLFAFALAIWAVARFCDRPNWPCALWFTFAVTGAALLRPDGALAAVAFAPAILICLLNRHRYISNTMGVPPVPRTWGPGKAHPEPGAPRLDSETWETTKASTISLHQLQKLRAPSFRLFSGERVGSHSTQPQSSPSLRSQDDRRLLRMALVCTLLALAPFAVWTVRNWAVFHVFQPLAPRLATDPGEDTHDGWERWVKTWSLDFITTYYVYWNVPDDVFDVSKLPARAFDTPQQYAETAALAAVYNHNNYELTPQLDARFAKLAEERIAAHPLRYYVFLPLGRVADMWLRPRVENLPINLDWWVYSNHHSETRFSWEYAALNAFYLVLGAAGLMLRPPFWKSMLAYMLMRSALLLTVEAPEARYTLEAFPMLFILGGIAIAAGWQRFMGTND